MYIVRLTGGLGNQLFQISTALSISENRSKSILIDRSSFFKDKKHGGYRLNYLRLPEFKTYNPNPSVRYIVKILDKFPVLTLVTPFFFHEKEYSDELKKINRGYLIGYWQDHKYFDKKFDVLKKYFVPAVISLQEEKMSKLIRSCDSVSVHVRRGDYTQADVIKNHGICSTRYYEKAIEIIKDKLTDPHFFVFTNDHQWVADNLADTFSGSCVTYVKDHSQEVDLWLMSQCKHNVIANSSFSWWGAYLASHDEQIVISPYPWYERPQRGSSDPSLNSWMKVKKR